MNLAWITPFFAESAIGQITQRVAVALHQAGHHVVVFGTGRPPYVSTQLPFVAIPEGQLVHPGVFAQFDAAIHNVGNHATSFPMFWLLERTPGIVVLHDRIYTHGLDAFTRALGQPGRLETMARRYYGEDGVAFVHRFRSGAASNEELERYSFIEPLLQLAPCVIVHSGEFRDLVTSRWPGRVATVSGLTLTEKPATAVAPRSAFGIGEDDFVLAFVGYITRNRAIETLLDVLRDRPDLAARTKVAILGRVEDPAYANGLQHLAAQYGLNAIMRWGFNAADDLKHSILSIADAAYNCRSFNTEGSPASLLEEMSYGLPVVVNNNGFARDIPADAVCLVERDRLRTDVESQLGYLIAHPVERKAIGSRALAYIATNTTPEQYARSVAALVDETAGMRTLNAAKGRMFAVLDEMGLTDGGGTLGSDLSKTIDELLAPR